MVKAAQSREYLINSNKKKGVKTDRQNVQSSNLRSIGYDQSTEVLEIEFHSGSIYQYFNVAESVYLALRNAASKGNYFHSHIREHYRYKRIR